MSDALSSPEKWAARSLGLPEGIDAASARASLLRELAADGFVPPLGRQTAWTTLCHPSAVPPDAARRAAEIRLGGEIDDFAAEFFDLPPAERQRRWQALAARATGMAPFAARLSALEPALNVVPPSESDPKVYRLVAALASLFVLAPLARATQRQAIVNGLKANMADWEAAARVVDKKAPAVAALDPQLMDAIKSWRKLQGRLAQARAGARPRPRSTAKVAAAPAPTSSGGSGFSGRSLIWIAFLVIGGGAKLCSGLGSHSTPPPQFEQPVHFEPPQFQPPKEDDWQKMVRDMNRRNEEERQRQRLQQPWDAPEDKPWEEPGQVKGIGTAADEKPRRP